MTAYVSRSIGLHQAEKWEQDQREARQLKVEKIFAQREADYKRAHPNWEAEEAAEQAAFEVLFEAIWQRLGSDDEFRQAAAERYGPGYWSEADAMTDAHRVETLERQILLDAETRAEVAASLAESTPFDTTPPFEPVPVEDSATEEETDAVELVRMPPLPEQKRPAHSAPIVEAEPVPVDIVGITDPNTFIPSVQRSHRLSARPGIP
jgi:hypothetical protein